ncbi:hypothetical protein M501DRAFT_999166 [Patellaria atrata CBS 101060]|uniref:Uncharacterized protein n=1 Tax=Patellaria atrata CBS 101060 TaxID=1346257 RepID=A0A9P4VN77_9PEZI|nr:hypothetical protein M501DRAFT_999166 [Patellaria atrata CBS 101060]
MVLLAFVDQSVPGSHKDEEARRLVRSHAMRDFRHRQRTKHAGTNATAGKGSKPTQTGSALHEGLNKGNQNRSPQSQKASCGVEHPQSNRQRKANGRKLRPRDANVTRKGDTSAEETTRGEHCCRFSTKCTKAGCRDLWKPPRPIPAGGFFTIDRSEKSISAPRFNALMEMLVYYVDFLHINLETGAPVPACSPIKAYWSLAAARSESLLFACCLVYRCHMDSSRDSVANDFLVYQTSAIRRIQQDLQNPETASSDETIGTVLCLCSAENMLGGSNLLTHIRGLQNMAELRGGLDHLSESGNHLREMIMLQDILNAACNSQAPFFFEVENPQLTKPYTHPHDVRYCFDNPLWVSTATRPGCCDNIIASELADSLMSSLAATNSLYRRSELPLDSSTVPSPSYTTPELTHSLTKPTTLKTLRIEICRLASIIHNRAASHLIPHHDRINHPVLQALHAVCRKTTLEDWTDLPFVYIWILLTGGAAAGGRPERRLFMAELIRASLGVGLNYWGEYVRFAMGFLWIQKAIRGEVFPVGRCEEVVEEGWTGPLDLGWEDPLDEWVPPLPFC